MCIFNNIDDILVLYWHFLLNSLGIYISTCNVQLPINRHSSTCRQKETVLSMVSILNQERYFISRIISSTQRNYLKRVTYTNRSPEQKSSSNKIHVNLF